MSRNIVPFRFTLTQLSPKPKYFNTNVGMLPDVLDVFNQSTELLQARAQILK